MEKKDLEKIKTTIEGPPEQRKTNVKDVKKLQKSESMNFELQDRGKKEQKSVKTKK